MRSCGEVIGRWRWPGAQVGVLMRTERRGTEVQIHLADGDDGVRKGGRFPTQSSPCMRPNHSAAIGRELSENTQW